MFFAYRAPFVVTLVSCKMPFFDCQGSKVFRVASNHKLRADDIEQFCKLVRCITSSLHDCVALNNLPSRCGERSLERARGGD